MDIILCALNIFCILYNCEIYSGYMAPEYVMHGHLSVKADVFSYGVLVLELISGQRNSAFSLDVDSNNLLDWVRLYYPIICLVCGDLGIDFLTFSPFWWPFYLFNYFTVMMSHKTFIHKYLKIRKKKKKRVPNSFCHLRSNL